MTTWTVKQSGGDYSTLASALSNASTSASDIISIEGTWSVDDTAAATIIDDNITIQTDASSNHFGVEGSANYRLEVSGSHCITCNNTGFDIDGLVVVQTGTGSSDEGIRAGNFAGTVQNCLIRANTATSSQDGIYLFGTAARTVNVINTSIIKFNRGGIHLQNADNTTANINSCTIWGNGADSVSGSQAAGGIAVANTSSSSAINVFNTMSLGNTSGTGAADYRDEGANTWNIDNCIDSDNTIAGLDGGAVGALASRTITDSAAPGAGDWVMVNDVTSSPYDLTLQDDATNNDAQDAHSNTTGAGLTLPTLDIEGDTRDTASGKVDIGVDAFPAAGITAAITGTATASITESDIVTGGKTVILTLTGDTFVTGTTSEDGIAAGSDSDKTGANKWDALIKSDLDNTDVVLSGGNTIATITLPAYASYDTDEQETITWTIPAASLTTSADPIVASPTFTVDLVAGAQLTAGSLMMMGVGI